jgi:hypothetical protein
MELAYLSKSTVVFVCVCQSSAICSFALGNFLKSSRALSLESESLHITDGRSSCEAKVPDSDGVSPLHFKESLPRTRTPFRPVGSADVPAAPLEEKPEF